MGPSAVTQNAEYYIYICDLFNVIKITKKIKKNAELCSHFRPKKLKVSVICSKNNQRGKTCNPHIPSYSPVILQLLPP